MHAQRPEQLRRDLQAVESRVERLTHQLDQATAARDAIVVALTDSDGQHDRRPTAIH